MITTTAVVHSRKPNCLLTPVLHRFLLYCGCAMLLAGGIGCNRHGKESHGTIVEAYVPDSSSVGFDITPLPSESGSFRLLATYTSQGKTAKFRIEFGPATATEGKNYNGAPFTFGDGRFVAEAGSDASVLLADLKKALEAKTLPTKVQRSDTLKFTFVNLGENLSQAPDGGFNEKPSGNWTAMKIFLGEGDDEAEVFLNINSVIRKGQFSIKDADYGDLVLAKLAKVL